jgi:cell division protein FtsI (penicillin-binding protein 3)
MLIFSGAVLWQLCKVQLVEGKKWKALALKQSTQKRPVQAVRGNILSDDGSLLATSLPQYEIRLDGLVIGRDPDEFRDQIDSLGIKLHELFPDKSAEAYVREIKKVRGRKDRYYLLRRGVSFIDLKKLKTLPLFDQGNYKSGLMAVQENHRIKPFGNLASRTIGYYTEKVKPVGLEGAYRESINGKPGQEFVQKLAGGIWVPVQDEPEINPVDGDDIVSTINIRIQDVAQDALWKAMIENQADHGCVLVMKVSTGEIKAIANLTRTSKGNYEESYNYAIGESSEPGSTFKLATYLVALENHKIDTNTLVDTHNGRFELHGHNIVDAHTGLGIITAKKAFEESSNVAAASLINDGFENNPRQFTNGLLALGLNKRMDLQIPGEGWPRIKNPSSKDWSGLSLEQMAYGYEVKLTPLQMLTLYNAVANNGVEVAPLLVKQIERSGKPVEVFEPRVINPAICSRSTLEKLKRMLEGVIEEGTGKDLKNKLYTIAGKTGTAQIAKGAGGYGKDKTQKSGDSPTLEKSELEKKYQASFCGYFPADNPEYTIMVVINDPSSGKYYAAAVAEPVFGEIADKIFASRLDLHPVFARIKKTENSY